MEKRDWEIVYSSEDIVEMHALEMLYGEVGNVILRDQNIYALYTLVCRKACGVLPARNAIVIGTLEENALLRRFIEPSEVPLHGFRVRIVPNPEYDGKQLVLIAGQGTTEVLYGVVTFLDEIIPALLPRNQDWICSSEKLFQEPFPELDYSDAPESLVRSVFTWGHPVGNHREYFRNMARLKINRVYLWNEYPPVNAAEVTCEAHGWGIEIFWGFSWGWSTSCDQAELEHLDSLSDDIVKDWHENWEKLPGDGIYFQSFTELFTDKIREKSIAHCVTELVNKTAGRILSERKDLRIVYGLHAISVKEQLKAIASTDSRLEILWEDCGSFPYRIDLPDNWELDDAFTRQLLAQNHTMGLVFKCQLMQKWGNFTHQAGPYVEGRNGEEVMRQDVAVTKPLWREYDALWMQKGLRAYELAKLIHEDGGESVELNMAAQLNGPVHLPTALAAELFWNTKRPYDDIMKRIVKRNYVIL